eukprot:6469681-Amphidinium_carterae.1
MPILHECRTSETPCYEQPPTTPCMLDRPVSQCPGVIAHAKRDQGIKTCWFSPNSSSACQLVTSSMEATFFVTSPVAITSSAWLWRP